MLGQVSEGATWAPDSPDEMLTGGESLAPPVPPFLLLLPSSRRQHDSLTLSLLTSDSLALPQWPLQQHSFLTKVIISTAICRYTAGLSTTMHISCCTSFPARRTPPSSDHMHTHDALQPNTHAYLYTQTMHRNP